VVTGVTVGVILMLASFYRGWTFLPATFFFLPLAIELFPVLQILDGGRIHFLNQFMPLGALIGVGSLIGLVFTAAVPPASDRVSR
jgi:hypothetical protein